jgi:hypothetical protein
VSLNLIALNQKEDEIIDRSIKITFIRMKHAVDLTGGVRRIYEWYLSGN